MLLGCDFGPVESGGEGPVVLRSDPEAAAEGVDRGARLRVTYDRPLDPRRVNRDTVTLRSGPHQPFLEVRFDPVGETLVVRPFRGRPLEPSVRYTLRVAGARDLDGAEAAEWTLSFQTAETVTEPPEEGTTRWAGVEPLFAERCVTGCHDGSDGGLDLCTLASARATAVGVPADQTGGTGAVARLGLAGMALIEESDPARSYLIYKMLGDPHTWGEPMPPEGPLPRADVARVADWILGGVR